jgi:hypothetical protein
MFFRSFNFMNTNLVSIRVNHRLFSNVIIGEKEVRQIINSSENLIHAESRLNDFVSTILRKKTERAERGSVSNSLMVKHRRIRNVTISTIGGVHQNENEILALYENIQANTWRDSRKPLTEEDHVGIEIEMLSLLSTNQLGTIATGLGLKQYLSIGSDGSIKLDNNSQNAVELRLCIPQSKLELILAKVQVLLSKAQAVVNKSCGLHIHLDMRKFLGKGDNRIEEVYENLKKGIPLIKKSIDPDRLNSKWCRFTTSKTVLSAQYATSRYRAINMKSLYKYKTIEIRAFQGTVNTDEILQYVMLLNKIVATKSPYKRATSNMKTLEKLYGKQVLDFVKSQSIKYNNVA